MQIMHRLIFLLLCLQQITNTFGVSYRNYTLFRGIPVNQDHLNFYHNLTFLFNANIWRFPSQINKPVDFVIGPKEKSRFYKEVYKQRLYIEPVVKDVQQLFNQQTVKSYVSRRTETFDWQNFYRLADIYSWLRDLAALYPRKMRIRVIGKTQEEREILAVVINHRKELKSERADKVLPKKKVIIEGGIHTREWISLSFVTYLLNEILHAPFNDDAGFRKIAYTYEWHFVPVLNPDGYEYTHTKDRLWRKNRNGEGVDLNRNFDYSFGTKGVSFDPAWNIYCGPKQFSELETQAMSSFIAFNSKNLEYYFAFHSYGQYLIIPYADSTGHQDNYDYVHWLAKQGVMQLQQMYGTEYTVGTAFDTVGYLSSGVSGDWVKKTFSVPVVSTFELRDKGRYGFALPPNLIIPTCKETIEALKVMMRPRSGNKLENVIAKYLHSDTNSAQQGSRLGPLLLIFYIVL